MKDRLPKSAGKWSKAKRLTFTDSIIAEEFKKKYPSPMAYKIKTFIGNKKQNKNYDK